MPQFSQRIIDWQKLHGRHDLPWQNTVDAYAIWVSEIMLQQTQVTAVIGYYAKFMQRFPSIEILAAATQEDVLQYWSGLGYYSRARNLHAASQMILDDFGGVFPTQFTDIQSLPGIGRSTAAAISTFALNLPQPILDGNVKRVFARHFNVAGYTGAPKVAQQLWKIAERENPQGLENTNNAINYTQGLMDLGATICTRTKPNCFACPVSQTCEALTLNLVKKLPTPKPRKTVPEKNVTMLIYMHHNTVLLEKRPPSGIWGGLWSLPEVADLTNISDIALQNITQLSPLTHTFTHFKLHITPQLISVGQMIPQVNQAIKIWLPIEEAITAAIPTPIRKILMSIKALSQQNI